MTARSWWAAPKVAANSDDLGAVILMEPPGEIVEDSPSGPNELRAAYRPTERLI
ncbi:MAG: hypothetical protein QF413_10225 [Dehalococcoidia bacterium]|nr:hypothetical protein [Dehalococcoidia bacterium]